MADYTDQIAGVSDPVFPLVVNSKLDATVDPTVNDDSADGYSVGSLWVNVSTDSAWVLTDAAVGAAVWTPITGLGNGAAVSILGRAADSSGGRADIAAADNAQLLWRGANEVKFSYLSDILDAIYGSTPGSLLVRTSSWEILTPGGNGAVLTIVGGVPAWV